MGLWEFFSGERSKGSSGSYREPTVSSSPKKKKRIKRSLSICSPLEGIRDLSMGIVSVGAVVAVGTIVLESIREELTVSSPMTLNTTSTDTIIGIGQSLEIFGGYLPILFTVAILVGGIVFIFRIVSIVNDVGEGTEEEEEEPECRDCGEYISDCECEEERDNATDPRGQLKFLGRDYTEEENDG